MFPIFFVIGRLKQESLRKPACGSMEGGRPNVKLLLQSVRGSGICVSQNDFKVLASFVISFEPQIRFAPVNVRHEIVRIL